MERLKVPRRPLSETISEMICARSCSAPKGTRMMAMMTVLRMEKRVRKAME